MKKTETTTGGQRKTALITAFVLTVVCGLLPLLPFVERVELRTHDWRFHVRGSRLTNAKIVIIAIDHDTEQSWSSEPMAAWPAHWARIIRIARANGARVIGLDVIHPLPFDDYLLSSVKLALKMGGWSNAAIEQFSPTLEQSPDLQPDAELSRVLHDEGDHVVLSRSRDSVPSMMIQFSGALIASVDIPSQSDAVVRTLTTSVDGEAAFPVVLAKLCGTKTKGVGASGSYWINYVTDLPGTAFTWMSAAALERGSIPANVLAKLKDAVVLIGDAGQGSNDEQLGPGETGMAGVEINAHAVATLIDGRPLRRGWRAQEALCTLAVALLAGVATSWLRFWKGAVAIVITGIAWIFTCHILFQKHDFLLPMSAPAVGILLPWAGCHIAQAVSERRIRLRVEQIFGRYTSPRVRDYLLASPDNLALGGFTGDATALLFDLRGSVAFADNRPPTEVMAELNVLFDRIVPSIQQHDGLILRYTGDGFLALFGAPRPQQGHASAAVQTVLEMDIAIRKLNMELKQAGKTPWKYGCGINTGPLVYGNLGTADRPEFTIIGDTVNMAARFQDATKELKAVALMGSRTYFESGCPKAAGPISYHIRGKANQIDLYSLWLPDSLVGGEDVDEH